MIEMRKPKTIEWIKEHAEHDGDDCLLWPFCGNWNGYGQLQFEGRVQKAHRIMCIVAHGSPPTPAHVAAHSCHNPRCVNPRHLSWKTPRENQLDRRKDGTAKRRSIWSRTVYKVTDAQKAEIRRLKGTKNQREIAAMYGISYQHVSLIQRGLSKQPQKSDASVT